MRDVKWFDTDDLGPQPARKHSPDRMVIGPPRHRLPLVITSARVGLRPDAVAPGLSHGEVADHDLGGSQSQPHQLGLVRRRRAGAGIGIGDDIVNSIFDRF